MANGTPSFTQMSQRIPPIDYTSRDFEAISQDMVRTIPFFAPEWTDHNITDFGIVLQRLTAFVADVLHFYIDRAANEAFLPTAITRRSVINLLQLINYELRSAVPASVDIQFTLQTALSGDFLIPAGTELQTTADATEVPVFFETVEDLIITTGLITGTVSAVEGLSGNEDVGISTGFERQRFPLLGNPIIDGTIQVFIDEGVGDQLWTEVETFITSDPDSKVFTSEKDEDGRVVIFFGDNAQGKIPDPGSPIRAEFRTGGGENGNVPANTITALNDALTFGGVPVTPAVTNPLAASGGEDEQSIDSAKAEGPQSLLTLNRAVTLDDYRILAEGFPGVAKALATVGGPTVDEGFACCCTINLSIAPVGGGQPSTFLKESLLEFFDAKKMAGTCVIIQDPVFKKVDQIGTVTVSQNFDIESVTACVLDAITAFFGQDSDFTGFGKSIFLSDVISLVDQCPGVDHVDYTEITCQPAPVSELGAEDCTVDGFVIGSSSKEEDWTIIFTSGTTYTVRGSVSGLQVATGTTGVEYVSDGSEITFTVTCTSAPAIGDRITFETCQKFANVPMDPNQIPEEGATNLTFVGGATPQAECS
jgi:hypothetical protein